MAQKTRKETQNKKQQKQQEKLMLVGVGLLFVLFSIFGFFHLGFRNLDCQRVSDRWRKHTNFECCPSRLWCLVSDQNDRCSL